MLCFVRGGGQAAGTAVADVLFKIIILPVVARYLSTVLPNNWIKVFQSMTTLHDKGSKITIWKVVPIVT